MNNFAKGFIVGIVTSLLFFACTSSMIFLNFNKIYQQNKEIDREMREIVFNLIEVGLWPAGDKIILPETGHGPGEDAAK